MLSLPFASRILAGLLGLLGFYLAAENTMISANVLGSQSGASVVASAAIAVLVTGVELVATSTLVRGDDFTAAWSSIRRNPLKWVPRLFVLGILLGLVYHFDVLTTALHPGFRTENAYFFGAVVGAFVGGPEICIAIAAWLWRKSRDIETRLMADNNAKDAENEYRRSERQSMMAMARAAGEEAGQRRVISRFGQQTGG